MLRQSEDPSIGVASINFTGNAIRSVYVRPSANVQSCPAQEDL
jgi:hypothetical protein